MLEGLGVGHCLSQSMPVFDVGPEVADPRVENITKGVFSEEKVADYPHAFCILVVDPQSAQIGYGVDCFLELEHVVEEIVEGHLESIADLLDDSFILFDEGNDGLSIVFGDIFGLVLDRFLYDRYFFLTSLGLILRDSFLLGDPPRLFVVVTSRKHHLWEYGMGLIRNKRAVSFLLLDELIEHAVVVKHTIVLVSILVGKDVFELDLA